MVEPAVADIIGPAVAAHDPDALLHQGVGQTQQVARFGGVQAGEFFLEELNALALREDALLGLLVGVDDGLCQVLADGEAQTPDQLAGVFGLLVGGQTHAEPELGVVFKQ